MAIVNFNKQQFVLDEGESVLDGLLRNGQDLSHSCKSGLCQSCLIQSKDVKVPDVAQVGLKSSLQASAHALACQWIPETDISIALPGPGDDTYSFSISALQPLNPSVMKLVLQANNIGTNIECIPGQYFSLINPDKVVRSYSLANDYARDSYLEFHIASTKQGVFSNWLFNESKVGDQIQVRGPAGTCFYTQESSELDEPILLSGVGTGLAPLYGILRNALEHGHRGQVSLVHGARNSSLLYYQDELGALVESYSNFSYIPVVREEISGENAVTVGDVETLSLAEIDATSLANTRVYLCGNPGFVQRLRKQIFLRGIRASNIFCDAFVERSHE